MYKVDVRVDGKEAAATERRRIQEYQRQSRIFNAKQRLIGVRVTASEPSTFFRNPFQVDYMYKYPIYVTTYPYACMYVFVHLFVCVCLCVQVDVKAIEEQVSEKKMRESIEQQRDEAFGEHTGC